MKDVQNLKTEETMNKYEFIKYATERYGIDEGVAETMIDIFANSLHDLLSAGYSVNIDEIGEFKTTPLFPNGLNHQGVEALKQAMSQRMVSFTASPLLTRDVA